MTVLRWIGNNGVNSLISDLLDSERYVGNVRHHIASNVWEEDKRICVEIDLPGVDISKVDLSLEERYILLKGKRESEKEKEYYIQEVLKGEFEKYIELPDLKYDADGIEAQYKNGELRVNIPKKVEEKKRIEILNQ